MTKLIIEKPTRFRESIAWTLHHTYFEQRGAEAWRSGEVPHYSTSNYAIAKQHAEFLAALVADGEAADDDSQIWVLEVGSGLGLFAVNFLSAIHDEPHLAHLKERVHYAVTDYAENSVRQALAMPRMKRFVDGGFAVGALFDLREPQRVRLLDGGTLTHALHLVVANYVCCVLPQTSIQRRADGTWHEQTVEVRAESDDPNVDTREKWIEALTRDATRFNVLKNMELHYGWEQDTLEALVPEAMHRDTIAAATGDFATTTMGYPAGYLTAVHGMEPLLADGGAILTVDYGSGRLEKLEGAYERRPQMYGNSFAQEVNVALFKPWADVVGWSCMHTTSDVRSLHLVVVSPRPFGPKTTEVFEHHRKRHSDYADQLLDLGAAGRVFIARKEPARALRFYLKAIDMDPWHLPFRYSAGELAIDVGAFDLAIEQLLKGHDMDTRQERDFDFHLGRAYAMVENIDEALKWYAHSLSREKHPVTYTNVGVLHMYNGNYAQAYAHFNEALKLDPSYQRGQERLNLLKNKIWEEAVAGFQKELGAGAESADENG